MTRVTGAILVLAGLFLAGSDDIRAGEQEQSKDTIVPGAYVGDYTVGTSKDDVLKKLGEPKAIHFGEEEFSLDDLPRRYYLAFGDLSFLIVDGCMLAGPGGCSLASVFIVPPATIETCIANERRASNGSPHYLAPA